MIYNNTKFKIWTWRHPFMLHWIINPGLVINELILGQRIPRTILVERDSTRTLQEKTKIPCPHCATLHPGLKWSARNNAFKNWFGLYCDNCGKTIPCLTNIASYLVLGVTFPIWIWFRNKWRRDWLNKQPKRYQNLDLENVPNPFEGLGWIKRGLSWGFFMYIIMTLIFPLVEGEHITWEKSLSGILVWTIAGLVFGYMMKLITGKSVKAKMQ